MDGNNFGANEFTIEELEELFNSTSQQETPPATDDTTDTQDENNNSVNNVETTKAFAHRLKESTEKARKEERETIAKSMGYANYDEMIKAKERKTFEDKGFDPDEVSPLVEELVNQRISNDPRMKEFADFRKHQVEEFGKKELAEITKLTGGQITKFEQLSKDVIDLWQKEGSLKAAYLKLNGEMLINQMRGEQSKGTTDHLASFGGTSLNGTSKQRPLTKEERKAWKVFHPNMTDEELDKMKVDI